MHQSSKLSNNLNFFSIQTYQKLPSSYRTKNKKWLNFQCILEKLCLAIEVVLADNDDYSSNYFFF